MARFEDLSVAEAFEVSVAEAEELTGVHSALVALGRALAERVDLLVASGFIDENGKLDNVTVSKFLECVRGLGLMVADGAAKKSAPAKKSELEEWRERQSKKAV